ncbi:15873_t:CDS:2 [Cetraspora pellucida]|uniref:15873_t:CDS:1 n=1 Tax=Cetraspora pellucida TaxID=1433469 RepID=A0ACA9N7U0_9GLOM|nr:15873_t:CDS:2 [Cetraspora pellucida]
MTEETTYDVVNEMASNDVASIISSASSEYDPVKEIALQLGVEYIEYPDFEDVITIKTGKNILVKQAIWKEESRKVALKYIFDKDTEEQHKKLEHEIMRALQNLDDDNLMQLYGVSQDLESTNCMLVLQYADSGNLREFLDHKELPWTNKLRIARDIAYGLRHLHKAGVVHGDLHTQNIFINNYEAFIKAPRMILPDDTSASYYNAAPETIPYVDPKIVNDVTSLPDRHSDIYSLGITLWELSTSQLPFKGQTRLTVEEMLHISRDQRTIIPEEYTKLLQDCWNDDPEMRLTIEQICKQLKGFLRDDPSSQLKDSKMDESGENFTFNESTYPTSKDIQANGHSNTQSSHPSISNDLESRRRPTTESAVNQRQNRYSKIFQTLKFDFQRTKTRLFDTFSKLSCFGSKNVDT